MAWHGMAWHGTTTIAQLPFEIYLPYIIIFFMTIHLVAITVIQHPFWGRVVGGGGESYKIMDNFLGKGDFLTKETFSWFRPSMPSVPRYYIGVKWQKTSPQTSDSVA
jgi:hypothetical protein